MSIMPQLWDDPRIHSFILNALIYTRENVSQREIACQQFSHKYGVLLTIAVDHTTPAGNTVFRVTLNHRSRWITVHDPSSPIPIPLVSMPPATPA